MQHLFPQQTPRPHHLPRTCRAPHAHSLAVPSSTRLPSAASFSPRSDGDTVDSGLLKRCTEVYVSVGQGSLSVYGDTLESPLLETSRAYYKRKSQDWLAALSAPDYLAKAEQALVSEAQRVERFLHETTESVLLAAVEQELLAAHATALLEREGSGLAEMLRNDRGVDLARL